MIARGISSLRSALAFKLLSWAVSIAPPCERMELAHAINRYATSVR